MFFQDASVDPTSSTSTAAIKDFNILTEAIKKSIANLTDLRQGIGAASQLFQRLIIQSDELNKTFVGGRIRFQEISKAINDAAPDVTRLGGTFDDVRKTISEIAGGTRTQLIATTKDVRELFAAGKILDQSVLSLVDSFDKVGISYSDVAKNLQESIVYVQSVGQNARSVMKDVVTNTEQLSRFNFQNGVQGLTKMAAQASMLRFDMKKTFEFAESVLDPEKAIQMASSFQRLGVAVGSLGDPLSLLNQSLTDPSGLQNSLISMTKQFTYFDETSKSFKISPQGILTMKELADATGITAAELRKTALAAAEMDSKLAKINTTGLNFEVSEENKMLIANVARMGEGGEYEVSIKDERGYEYQKNLIELQEEDFKRIIEQQSKAPKTIEEIQTSQLNTAEKMLAELEGIKENLTTAFFQLPGMQQSFEGGVNTTRQISELFQRGLEDTRFKTIMKDLDEKTKEIRGKKLSKEDEKKEIDQLFNESKAKISEIVPEIFNTASVNYKKISSGVNENLKPMMETIDDYYKSLFGGREGEVKSLGMQAPKTKREEEPGYKMLTTSSDDTLTNRMSAFSTAKVATGNVININSPAISYSPTINPQLQGVNSPQELIDLVNKGGLQLSEQLAKNLYESLRKLDLIRQSP